MIVSPEQDDRREQYSCRAALRRERAERLERRHVTYANLRIVVFIAIGLCVWLAATARASLLLPLVPAAVFLVLVVRHDATLRSLSRARRSVAYYSRGLARLEDRPLDGGADGSEYADLRHSSATDLDLFGPGSLFQLLNAARTRGGEARLASWLLHPAPAALVLERQEAIRALIGAIDLREDLAVLGDEVQTGVHPDQLIAWCSREQCQGRSWRLACGVALAAGAVASVVLWSLGITGGGPLLVVVAGQIVHRRASRRLLTGVSSKSDLAVRDLKLLSELLDRLKDIPADGPLLRRLGGSLESHGAAPARSIRRLDFLVDCFEARRNGLFAPISFLLHWDVLFAEAIERWRAAHGTQVPAWLDSVAEIEALASISGYAYERPDETFPTVLPAGDGPVFDAVALGHPLLPRAQCVRNDVRLDRGHSLLIVSGSNMSGKSTFLRSIGIAAVMAQAGAPVRAAQFTISELAVGASIRVQDSLQEGTSRFYAEIQRLRQIVELSAGGAPLLFLIDEILQGTNSHDRLTGSSAVLRTLLAGGAMGLITTHDLTLTGLTTSLGPGVRNVHFEDRVELGKMHFDYVLREGVVQKSNAIQLMRAAGLTV